MASIDQTLMAPTTGDQVPAAQQDPGNLHYSSDCVVYLFFGRDQGDPQGPSDIWIRMTRRDLDSPGAFRRALTQYIQSAVSLGTTHYYTHFGDILIFPISWPSPQGDSHHRRRLILRTEPLNDGQIYSLLPEDVSPGNFPAGPVGHDLVGGSPFDGPCRQIQALELERVETITSTTPGEEEGERGSWAAAVEAIARLRGLADREQLPPGMGTFAYVVGEIAGAGTDGDAGRGAWTSEKLAPLLTREFLDEAGEEYARTSSGALTNGWH